MIGCCGWASTPPLEEEIEYFEKRLIPLLKEYNPHNLLKKAEIRLKEMKTEELLKELIIGEKKNG